MTHQEAVALLSRITYKQGWSITLEGTGPDTRIFVKSPPTMDTHDHNNIANVWIRHHLGSVKGLDVEVFISEVRHAVQALELHESQEWLKLDGVQIDRPRH